MVAFICPNNFLHTPASAPFEESRTNTVQKFLFPLQNLRLVNQENLFRLHYKCKLGQILLHCYEGAGWQPVILESDGWKVLRRDPITQVFPPVIRTPSSVSPNDLNRQNTTLHPFPSISSIYKPIFLRAIKA